MEDLNRIGDAVVIVCHPHTAKRQTSLLLLSPMVYPPDLHQHDCAAWIYSHVATSHPGIAEPWQ